MYLIFQVCSKRRKDGCTTIETGEDNNLASANLGESVGQENETRIHFDVGCMNYCDGDMSMKMNHKQDIRNNCEESKFISTRRKKLEQNIPSNTFKKGS